MDELLRACIANFGPPPRSFSLWDRWTDLKPTTPAFLHEEPDDELWQWKDRYWETLTSGTVTWGSLVQANRLVFEPGPLNCPGDFLFVDRPEQYATPKTLQHASHACASLKHTEPDEPLMAQIAHHVTDEYARAFGIPVPTSISSAVRCCLSSMPFLRKHLPKGYLAHGLIPVVVSAETPRMVVVLPSRYWP